MGRLTLGPRSPACGSFLQLEPPGPGRLARAKAPEEEAGHPTGRPNTRVYGRKEGRAGRKERILPFDAVECHSHLQTVSPSGSLSHRVFTPCRVVPGEHLLTAVRCSRRFIFVFPHPDSHPHITGNIVQLSEIQDPCSCLGRGGGGLVLQGSFLLKGGWLF